MDVRFVEARRHAGLVDVTLLVTTHGRAAETVTVHDLIEPFVYVRNIAGWVQAADGTWHTPFKLVDDEWVDALVDSDIAWARRPVTDDQLVALARPRLRDHHHRDFVARCKAAGFPSYQHEEHRVAITVKGPVHLDRRSGTGMVQIEIEAHDLDTGRPLWVHDGFWAFDWPPDVPDPAGWLRDMLAFRVRQMQP